MFKKALHRITVLWCLYGLARVVMFINPHLMYLFGKYIDPTFTPADMTERVLSCILVWLIVGVVLLFIVAVSLGINCFTNWFFNTGK